MSAAATHAIRLHILVGNNSEPLTLDELVKAVEGVAFSLATEGSIMFEEFEGGFTGPMAGFTDDTDHLLEHAGTFVTARIGVYAEVGMAIYPEGGAASD